MSQFVSEGVAPIKEKQVDLAPVSPTSLAGKRNRADENDSDLHAQRGSEVKKPRTSNPPLNISADTNTDQDQRLKRKRKRCSGFDGDVIVISDSDSDNGDTDGTNQFPSKETKHLKEGDEDLTDTRESEGVSMCKPTVTNDSKFNVELAVPLLNNVALDIALLQTLEELKCSDGRKAHDHHINASTQTHCEKVSVWTQTDSEVLEGNVAVGAQTELLKVEQEQVQYRQETPSIGQDVTASLKIAKSTIREPDTTRSLAKSCTTVSNKMRTSPLEQFRSSEAPVYTTSDVTEEERYSIAEVESSPLCSTGLSSILTPPSGYSTIQSWPGGNHSHNDSENNHKESVKENATAVAASKSKHSQFTTNKSKPPTGRPVKAAIRGGRRTFSPKRSKCEPSPTIIVISPNKERDRNGTCYADTLLSPNVSQEVLFDRNVGDGHSGMVEGAVSHMAIKMTPDTPPQGLTEPYKDNQQSVIVPPTESLHAPISALSEGSQQPFIGDPQHVDGLQTTNLTSIITFTQERVPRENPVNPNNQAASEPVLGHITVIEGTAADFTQQQEVDTSVSFGNQNEEAQAHSATHEPENDSGYHRDNAEYSAPTSSQDCVIISGTSVQTEPSLEGPTLQSQSSSELESDENFQQLFQEAIKDCTVSVYMAKCGVTGPPGSGKSNLCALILDKKRPTARQSTAIATEVDQASPDWEEELVTIQSNKDGSRVRWNVVDSNKMSQLAARTMCNYQLTKEKQNSQEGSTGFPIGNSTRTNVSTSPSTKRTFKVTKKIRKLFKQLKNRPTASKGRKLKCLREMKLVYLVDAGGQPQFQEIMPMFVRNSSVTLLVHKLTESLGDSPHFDYELDGTKFTVPEEMMVTNREMIEQSIRSVCSCSLRLNRSTVRRRVPPKPYVAVVGMFKDKCSDHDLQVKHRAVAECLDKFKESKKVEVLTSSRDKPVHAFDASEDGWTSNGRTMSMLRMFIEKVSKSLEVKVPLRWFIFLEILKEYSQKRDFISREECYKVGKESDVCMEEDDVDDALLLFDELNIMLHYSDILKNVVFCKPGFLFNKVSEIIVASFDCQQSLDIAQIEREAFRKTGIFSLQLLNNTKGLHHGHDDTFSQEDLIHLLIGLCIIADLGNDHYFMPCVLPLERFNADSSIVEKHRRIMNDSGIKGPLYISFGPGYSPRGLFCASIAYLAKQPAWIIRTSGVTDLCRKRNLIEFQYCVPMYLGGNVGHIQHQMSSVGTVMIVDRTSHFEVYSTCEKQLCPEIRKEIYSALWHAAVSLSYDPQELDIKVGFVCEINCEKPKPHGTEAFYSQSVVKEKCLKNHQKRPVHLTTVTSKLVWFPGQEQTAGPHCNDAPTLLLLMDDIATRTNQWSNIALELELKHVEMDRIRLEEGSIIDRFRRVFVSWEIQCRRPYTWTTMVETLEAPMVEEKQLANDLRAKYLGENAQLSHSESGYPHQIEENGDEFSHIQTLSQPASTFASAVDNSEVELPQLSRIRNEPQRIAQTRHVSPNGAGQDLVTDSEMLSHENSSAVASALDELPQLSRVQNNPQTMPDVQDATPSLNKTGDCELNIPKTVNIWQFILYLLDINEYQSVICWLNKEDGTFKICNHQAFTELWAKQKNKTGMTWKKVQSNIRYYYKNGILQHTKENHCYKLSREKIDTLQAGPSVQPISDSLRPSSVTVQGSLNQTTS